MTSRILHYSDIEGAFDRPKRIARLASSIESRRDDRTLVIGTGDNTGPSVLSRLTRGRVSLDFFTAVGTDVETFGNHEFDHGLSTIRSIIRDSPQVWVSGNVTSNSKPFGAEEGVVRSTMFERSGIRIGVVGVTDPRTPTINPKAADLTVTDPIDAVRRATDRLRSAGDADIVVVLSHLGETDYRLARSVNVDAILGGHTHDRLIDRVNGTVVTKPGVGGEGFVELELSTRSIRARFVSVNHDHQPHASLLESIQSRIRSAGLDEVLDIVDVPIDRSNQTVYGGECRIGNWVADAYRRATGADIGLQNSGGIRPGPPLKDEITLGECMGIAPFNEPIGLAELTGEELISVLSGASGGTIRAPDRWHAHLSGVHLIWDGDRNEPIRVHVDGERVDPGGQYTLATSNYVFETPHEFPALKPGHRIDSFGIQYDVLVEHARDVGFDTTVGDRITRLNQDTGRQPVESGVDIDFRGAGHAVDPAVGAIADHRHDR